MARIARSCRPRFAAVSHGRACRGLDANGAILRTEQRTTMEVVVGVLAVGVSVAAFVAVQERRRERTRVAWRAVARTWGFGVARADERGVLTAIRGPLGIRVKALRR